MNNQERTVWSEQKSGLILPAGREGQIREFHKNSFLEIKQMTRDVREVFDSNGVFIKAASSLSRIMDEACEISDAWLTGNVGSIPITIAYSICHAYRICTAVLGLSGERNTTKHLEELASGNLDLLSRKRSRAKDFLWEMELFVSFKNHGLSPIFEEPDISIQLQNEKVSVACKKVYSEKGVRKILSEAVSQIAKSKRIGIVAINLDDLHQENTLLKGLAASNIFDSLNIFNESFIARHEHYFRKYLESSRAAACLVSSSVVSDSINESPRINNHSQATVWVIPKIGSERQRIAADLYSRYFSGPRV